VLRTSFYQLSMDEVDPDFLRLSSDSFERHLRELLPRIVSADDFRDFYADSGTGSCCPLVLCGMLLLQFRYNEPDLEVIRRCRRDLGWRYALGLRSGDRPPGVTSLRRFRAKIRSVLGDDFLHRRVLELVARTGSIPDVVRQAVDSTNTDCRGAVIDTFNLVATGIGNVVRVVARCLGRAPSTLAEEWKLSAYMGRSVKGGARIDWSDEKARNVLLTQEIMDAKRLPALVSGLGVTLPDAVKNSLELLATVATQDVEELADGTYQIARGTARGRVISITDPEARHGRKSASKAFNGFKLHVMGTIESQFVTGIAVTDGATHDAVPTVKLLKQAEKLGLKPEEALGDAAYGTGANLRACEEVGVNMRTKLPTSRNKTAIPKREFDIDVDAGTVTCPEGHVATRISMVKAADGGADPVARHTFDKATCQSCPLRETCSTATSKGGARTLALSTYERELQDAIAFNKKPHAAAVLRSRSAVERLISHLVRMGMRHARFFGMQRVQFQAFMTSAAYNIQRLITLSTRATPRTS
jgi:hypothetical protein